MLLRLMGLGGRMVLTLYIARYLGLEATAAYGFVVGGSAAMVALTGFGLDQPLSRYLVTSCPLLMVLRHRDRLVVRSVAGIVLVGGATLILAGWASESPLLSWSVAIILLGEPIVYDMQQGLIARRRPVAANALLFARAGAWVPAVVIPGLLDPAWRSLDIVLGGWAATLVVAALVTWIAVRRRENLRRALRLEFDWQWIARAPRSMPLAYLADLGTVGMIYSDRYLVSALTGHSAAGIFVLLWSFTNAIVPLIQAAVFNHLTPVLISSRAADDHAAWRAAIRRGRRRTLILSSGLGIAMLGALLLLLPLVGVAITLTTAALSVLMIAANVTRLQADLLQLALVSGGDDRGWVRANVTGLIVSPAIGIAAIAAFGLIGAGIQMLATAILILVMRRRLFATLSAVMAEDKNDSAQQHLVTGP